jgi:hypothetical protein
MEQVQQLSKFFSAIEKDARIGASHISLYCALLQLGLKQHAEPVFIMAPEIMKVAKIAGIATYHKCIKELHEYGYIRYMPSYNHRKKSKVYLNQ